MINNLRDILYDEEKELKELLILLDKQYKLIIAKDIFGTYENYVLPVQTLSNKDDLINAFEWMKNNEDEIRNHLNDFMPSYKERALQGRAEIEKLLGE